MTWQLRRADLADLEAIMTIELGVFGTDAWAVETMRAELGSRHGYYLVAFPPGIPDRIEAYAGVHARRREPQADIQTVAVAPGVRRRGLGRLLVQRLIAEASERGATEVFLEVRADNPGARALYDSLGFESLAVRRGYYQPDGIDAIVMRHTIVRPLTTVAVTR